ncbi:chaperone protein dnaJ 20, chloroplastic-like [Canna indica]|uniref:Chaperone protein dnaJ 20, chloroplastic-like n=1 Tax=Canna indica TaxID=4628 RepID=A0AAQ3Q4M7_9LILI|nr:chaperone protein dnaJ 20, chloroplastic-like [Canna indica]
MLSFCSPIPKLPPYYATSKTRVIASAAARPAAAPAPTMYELLSVAQTARPEEIKAAYRRQARSWHPDACRAAGEEAFFAERFMRAREAYEVLSDPALRRDYDRGLLRADAWAAAVGGAVVLRRGQERRGGFADWESQLEELERRRRGGSEEDSWGRRMRRAHYLQPFD